MTDPKPQLQLMDDPVTTTLWYLKQLPLDAVASYLALLSAYAAERGMLSEDDQLRLTSLLTEILDNPHYRAA